MLNRRRFIAATGAVAGGTALGAPIALSARPATTLGALARTRVLDLVDDVVTLPSGTRFVALSGPRSARLPAGWLIAADRSKTPLTMAIDPHTMPSGERWFTNLVRVADRSQLRLPGAADLGIGVVAIDPGAPTTSALEILAPPRTPRESTAAQAVLAAPDPTPTIYPRSAWGARAPKESHGFARLTKLIVHHEANRASEFETDVAARLRAIQSYHMDSQQWSDIGYNFVVDGQGGIWEGRYSREYAAGEVVTAENAQGQGVIGAHAEKHNTGSVGVCLLGDFTDHRPGRRQMNGLISVLAWKVLRTGIDVYGSDPYTPVGTTTVETFPNLCGHRDTKATACPGNQLYANLPELRNLVGTVVSSARSGNDGHWLVTPKGYIGNVGVTRRFKGPSVLAKPVVGAAATPTNQGLWLAAADGGVFAYGDAGFHGSAGNIRLSRPVVGMSATPSGRGYWLVASDGGIFRYGDAGFYGSTGAIRLNQPVVGMARTPSGKGYWLVASDGGIFAFGDALFFGSTGAIRLNQPVIGMASTPTGLGYWLVAADGGVFTFGDARFHGSVPGLNLASFGGAIALTPTAKGGGYYIFSKSGGVYPFGDATFHGVGDPGSESAVAAVLASRTTT